MPFLPDEAEILAARQAFPDAQADLDGATLTLLPDYYGVGWYGTDISRERGSFALVNRGGPAEALIGDRIRLRHRDRSVVVYVVGTEDLLEDIHVTRRSFLALELLAVDRIDCTVEVLTG
jgi:hypothetical protein